MSRLQEEISSIVHSDIKEGQIAGANVLVLEDTHIIVKESYGMADMADKKPMKSNTIMRLFSMSKPITSAAAMLLLERGVIKLTDSVADYLPGFKSQKVAAGESLIPVNRDVTIYDLLNMTSGLVYPNICTAAQQKMGALFDAQISSILEGKGIDTLDFCNQMGQVPLDFQPGEHWQYGTSADVLGAVIEAASKKRFGDFLEEEFFAPLGMTDTSFYVPENKMDRFSEVYEYRNDEQRLVPYRGHNLAIFDYSRRPAFESGGAGLVSTIDDYAKFASMLMQEGTYEGHRILKEDTVRYLRTKQLNKQQKESYNWDTLIGCSYGNLVRVLESQEVSGRLASVGTYGWDGWTGPFLAIDPVKKITFLYMIQKVNAGTTPTALKLHDTVYRYIHAN